MSRFHQKNKNWLAHFQGLLELDKKSLLKKQDEGNFWKDNIEHIKK